MYQVARFPSRRLEGSTLKRHELVSYRLWPGGKRTSAAHGVVGAPVLLLKPQHARSEGREPCRRRLKYYISIAARDRYVLLGHTVEIAESASSKVSAA